MVGIYAKIKNGLNWIKNKATENVLPWVSKIGDLANSKAVQGIMGFATPALNSFIPGLGTGIGKGLNFLGKLGGLSNNVNQHLKSGDLIDYVINDDEAPMKTPKISPGIRLSRRPNALHERIKLKALPAPDDVYTGPKVEEID
jgi:hypothetical protein